MAKGPNGQNRQADLNGCAVAVARIATGEFVELHQKPSGRTKSAKACGNARVEALTTEERSTIAKKAAMARWR